MPVQLQRAMAAEAEAAREARAKVVAAEGEQKASLHLKEAALVLEESTSALQLRYLQVTGNKSFQFLKLTFSDTQCNLDRTKLDHRVSISNRHAVSFHGTG